MTASSDPRASIVSFPYQYGDDPFRAARPSSAYLGPSGFSTHGHPNGADLGQGAKVAGGNQVTYHGVCLTVWSHADAERTAASTAPPVRTADWTSSRARCAVPNTSWGLRSCSCTAAAASART